MTTPEEIQNLTIEELVALVRKEFPEFVADVIESHRREQDEQITLLREQIAYHKGFAAGREEVARGRSPLLERIRVAHRHSNDNGHTN